MRILVAVLLLVLWLDSSSGQGEASKLFVPAAAREKRSRFAMNFVCVPQIVRLLAADVVCV